MTVSGVGVSAMAKALDAQKDLMATVLAARPAVAQAQQTAAANLAVADAAVMTHFDAYL